MTIPKWKVAKTVSGVRKKSLGALITGRANHVLLLDNWNGRQKGQFLCGAKIRNQVAHQLFNLEGYVYLPQHSVVTCKKCQKILRRINNE